MTTKYNFVFVVFSKYINQLLILSIIFSWEMSFLDKKENVMNTQVYNTAISRSCVIERIQNLDELVKTVQYLNIMAFFNWF